MNKPIVSSLSGRSPSTLSFIGTVSDLSNFMLQKPTYYCSVVLFKDVKFLWALQRNSFINVGYLFYTGNLFVFLNLDLRNTVKKEFACLAK